MTHQEALSILRPEANTLEALKKAYRAAAKKYHPDQGGDLEIMKLVNLAYEKLKKDGCWSYEKEAWTSTPLTEVLMEKWRAISRIPGITGEVCGTWLWVSGDTRPVKEQLKALGFYFAGKKRMWYYRAGGHEKKYRAKPWSMERIRQTYGSQGLEKEESPVLS